MVASISSSECEALGTALTLLRLAQVISTSIQWNRHYSCNYHPTRAEREP